MSLANWNLFPNVSVTIVENATSPIQGTKSLTMTKLNGAGGAGGVSLVVRNDAVGTDANGFIRTLFSVNQGLFFGGSSFTIGLFCMGSGIVSFSTGSYYYVQLVGGGIYTLIKSVSGSLTTLINDSPGFPWNPDAGNIYALELIWQTQPITNNVTLSIAASPGVVTGSYDFSTMQIINQFVDSSSPLSPGAPGIYMTHPSNPGADNIGKWDVTQIC
jgi:hypothetical protein